MIGGRGAMVALVGLAGLLLVMAVVSGWQGTTRLTGRGDDTTAVKEAASAFVEAYGTFDFRDCIPAMGRFLLANGAPADMRRALYPYNHSWAYVDRVLAWAAAYGYVDPTSIPARAVELARSKVGAPYVWGASGPDAFDCSGLVLWVYSRLGLEVPRTAQQQFEWAVPIEPSQIQPGDLVFYENTSSSPDRVTHVGVYVGGGMVVMATNGGDFVREVPLSDGYWSAHFAGAGRPPYWEVPA